MSIPGGGMFGRRNGCCKGMLEHAFGVEQGGQSSWSGRSDGKVGDKGSNR